jgi:hypothetical protein
MLSLTTTTVGKLETTKMEAPQKREKNKIGSEPISATPSSLNSPCVTPLNDLNCVCTGEELVRPVPVFIAGRHMSRAATQHCFKRQSSPLQTAHAIVKKNTLKQQAVGHQSSIMHYES